MSYCYELGRPSGAPAEGRCRGAQLGSPSASQPSAVGWAASALSVSLTVLRDYLKRIDFLISSDS